MNLRTPIPTLEPDDAFVARLSALAAAGAPAPEVLHRPVPTWRVVLAAASVAAVLVGVAWLAGLDPTGSPNPAPQPATTPSAPEHSRSAAPESSARSTPESVGAFAAAPPATTITSLPAGTGRPDRSQEAASPASDVSIEDTTQGTHQGNPQNDAADAPGKAPDRPRGPNAHAGDHPNEHATTKSNQGHDPDDGRPDRGKGGRSGR